MEDALNIINYWFISMKINTLFLLLFFITMPLLAQTQQQMKKFVNNSIKQFKLQEVVKKIQTNKISTEQQWLIFNILKHTHEIYIHRQRGALDNQIFLHKDGHREAVYNKERKLVKDGINDASYNYAHPEKESLRHFTFGIHPWIVYGASKKDSTSPPERLHAYVADLANGMRRAIQAKKSWQAEAKPLWKHYGQPQALAIFLEVIKQGKAEIIFDLFKTKETLIDKDLIPLLKKLEKGFNTVYLPKKLS